MFLLEIRPPNDLPFSWGSETPSNKMCRWTPQVYLPNGI